MGKAVRYIMYIDIGPITRYIVTLNWAFFAVLLAISSVMCLLGFRFGRDIERRRSGSRPSSRMPHTS